MVEPNLKSHLKGKVAILGFGNRLWGDDGAGSVLAERLRAANPKAAVFDAGMVPENYLEKVVASKPEKVMLVDATDFGGKPGDWRIFAASDLSATGLSTHAGSPRMLAAYLETRTGANVYLLGIQPGVTRAGQTLSESVEAALAEAAKCL